MCYSTLEEPLRDGMYTAYMPGTSTPALSLTASLLRGQDTTGDQPGQQRQHLHPRRLRQFKPPLLRTSGIRYRQDQLDRDSS
jgi:hypothetical protein